MHAFRLKTKRLRYTLELFRACYGPSFEQRIEALKEMQTLLGEINDCAAGLRIARRHRCPAGSAHRRQVERFLKARARAAGDGVSQALAGKFDAEGKEDWWVGYLARKS